MPMCGLSTTIRGETSPPEVRPVRHQLFGRAEAVDHPANFQFPCWKGRDSVRNRQRLVRRQLEELDAPLVRNNVTGLAKD
jgi:hypothetical protein